MQDIFDGDLIKKWVNFMFILEELSILEIKLEIKPRMKQRKRKRKINKRRKIKMKSGLSILSLKINMMRRHLIKK